MHLNTSAGPSWHICINYHDSEPPRNMSWEPHGLSKSGFIQASHHGQSRTMPAVVAHRGRLWCMWSDLAGDIWYTCTNEEKETGFLPRKPLGERGFPLMAALDGYLHAIIVLDSGHTAHFVLDDDNSSHWVGLSPVFQATALPGVIPVQPSSKSRPALAAFQHQLFIAFVEDGALFYTVWVPDVNTTRPRGKWAVPQRVTFPSPQFNGAPALAVINGDLHLFCSAESDCDSDVKCYKYYHRITPWFEVTDVTQGRSARGVSATSYGDSTYIGFIEDSPADRSHCIYLSSYSRKDTSEADTPEPIARQTAADPPQITVLNGRIHCIFNDNTPTRDLRWYSRPILKYDLSSWMGQVPGDTLLSQLTIPGTHDSCARSNIPYVRTQYLSIKQQLALGIRFLDLRLRRHDDGQLYLYHGGVPLGLPSRLSFQAVMNDVWSFLHPDGLPQRPTETVLISIDNDDHSDPQKEFPELFYRAVESAILATPPYQDGSSRWFLDFSKTPTPTLDQVRGRAVLIRRYRADPSLPPTSCQGLDLSAWVNDSPDFTIVTPTGVRVHVQDKWRFLKRIPLEDLIATKSGYVQKIMTRAMGRPSPPDEDCGDGESEEEIKDWYINFCSAVGDPTNHGEVAQAKTVAVGAKSGWFGGRWIEGMNIITREYMETRKEKEWLRDDDDDDDDNDTDDNDKKDMKKALMTVTNRNGSSIRIKQRGETRTRRKRRRWYRLGVVNMDYPELPEENDIVARLIDVNFLNF
ncbi:phosphatidylinositol-specific phospholipase [Rhypophila sp. PSN 637]